MEVFNDPRAVRDHSEKLAIAKYPQFTAPTIVTRLDAQLQEFIDDHEDVVLKPLDGMGVNRCSGSRPPIPIAT